MALGVPMCEKTVLFSTGMFPAFIPGTLLELAARAVDSFQSGRVAYREPVWRDSYNVSLVLTVKSYVEVLPAAAIDVGKVIQPAEASCQRPGYVAMG